MLKNLLIGTAALAMVSTPIVASAQPAYGGGWRGEHSYARNWRGHDNTGAAVAAGLFGLVLGAAIASSNHPTYDYDRDYGYAQPYPVRCDWETRAYPGPYGSVSYQQVQVCR